MSKNLVAAVNPKALAACLDHYTHSITSTLVQDFTPEDPDYYDFTVPEYLYDRLCLEDEWGVALFIPEGIGASFTPETIVLRNSGPHGNSIEIEVDEHAPARAEATRIATELVSGINRILIPSRGL